MESKGLTWKHVEDAGHDTRFGASWAAGTGHWPKLGYVGLWNGLTAPPPRIGAAAPQRWPGRQPLETPPYILNWYRAFASKVVTDQLRLSDDPDDYQRLRDLKAH